MKHAAAHAGQPSVLGHMGRNIGLPEVHQFGHLLALTAGCPSDGLNQVADGTSRIRATPGGNLAGEPLKVGHDLMVRLAA